MPLALHARDLTKMFADDVGVRDLDLSVEEGTILGLIGPSGSGKTTTVRLLTGLLEPGSGDVEVLGEQPREFSVAAHANIGYLPQASVMYPNLTIAENIDFASAIYGIRGSERRARRNHLLEWLGLDDAADRRLEDASGGMRRRVGLAVAMIHEPDLLFLDEPTAGLDPILRQSLWERFEQLRSEGRTLVITTQYVGEAAHCDEIVVLVEGTIVAHGAPEALRRNAFGGELVDVVFTTAPSASALETLGRTLPALSVKRIDDLTARLTVEDAAKTLPTLSATAADVDLEVAETNAVVPSFDDVFVRLIDEHNGRQS